MLFGALIQNWKVIALAAIVAGTLIYRAVLVHQRDSARAQVTALSDAAAALRAENASMASAVTHQNDAINALQGKMKLAEKDAAQREAQYAARGAQAMSREVARANAVRNAPVPAGCQGCNQLGKRAGTGVGTMVTRLLPLILVLLAGCAFSPPFFFGAGDTGGSQRAGV
jgi:hypothetical protein